MKMDKAQLLVLVVGIAILLAWDPLCRHMGWFQVPVAGRSPAARQTPPPAAPADAAPQKGTASSPAPRTPAPAAKKAAPEPEFKQVPPMSPAELANKNLKLIIDPVSASVTDFVAMDYKTAGRKGDITIPQNLRTALTLVPADRREKETVTGVRFSGGPGSLKVIRHLRTADGGAFRMEHEWRLAEKGYAVDCRVLVVNESASPRNVTARVFTGGLMSSWAKVSGDTVRTPSHRVDYMTVNGKFKDISASADEKDFRSVDGLSVEWAGVSNKYFCLLLTAKAPFGLRTDRLFLTDGKESNPCAGCSAEIPGFTLGKGESREFAFTAYAGPKLIADLERFNPSAGRVMHLAWGPLDYLARLLLWFLVKIHSLGLSYGWSIIVLTLIVRILFYPATAKANASMKKMQAVQPKMKEIKERYKDNPQLMNAKMMELYRTEGVNPFGGCLPLLLQLPVFIALYTTLDGAVELRQVPFWWSPDLAGPDTVCRIPLYFFSLGINPLVLIMTALMIFQQHITPMGGDPMQKKMMMWMPVVMLLLFYDLPSGLTLYWSVSNVCSIIQLLIQKRGSNDAAKAAAVKS